MKLIKYAFALCIILATFSCGTDSFENNDESSSLDTELNVRKKKILCKTEFPNFYVPANNPKPGLTAMAIYLNTLFNSSGDGQFEINNCLEEMLGDLSPNRDCAELTPIITTGSGPVGNIFVEINWTNPPGINVLDKQIDGGDLQALLEAAFANSSNLYGYGFSADAQGDAAAFQAACDGGQVVVTDIQFKVDGCCTMRTEIEYSCCIN